MKPQSSLGIFFASAVAWFLALTLIWLQVNAWTSYPVAGIAHIALEHGARNWVRKTQKAPGRLEAETRIVVAVPGQGRERAQAELIVDVDPSHYAYGLPLFLALLLASRSRHLLRKALAGYVLLLFPQAVSLLFEILSQIMVAGRSSGSLEIASWQMEGIALGYQFGSLLLPTLAPTALWLWFEREFFSAVIVAGVSRAAAKQ